MLLTVFNSRHLTSWSGRKLVSDISLTELRWAHGSCNAIGDTNFFISHLCPLQFVGFAEHLAPLTKQNVCCSPRIYFQRIIVRTDGYLFGKLFARNCPMCPWVFWPKLGHNPIPESAVGKENRIIENKSLLLSVIFIPGFCAHLNPLQRRASGAGYSS